MSSDSIPVVDFRHFSSSDPDVRRTFVETLGGGLETFGFVAVEGHGIPDGLVDNGYEVARSVFALDESTKRAYETPEDGRQRGYTPFGLEHAKDTATPDLKEFWHVGRVLPDSHPATVAGDVPHNQFPAEVPAFETVMRELFASLEAFALGLLEAVGEHLELRRDFFTDMVREGNSVLRIIHYPDTGADVPVGAVRAAAHEDINLMTVLPASTRPGLELMTREGQWMTIDVPPGVMICDTGDMMSLVTAGRLPATTHRVVNPEGGSDGGRLSMPFFLHPRADCLLEPLEPSYAEPILTRAFLAERLDAIGVG